jgi:hypothetical protein
MEQRVFVIIPIISAALLFLVILRPGITGFIVMGSDVVDASIRISTADGVILPKESVVEVSIGDRTASMPVEDFISGSGKAYELIEGDTPELHYSGLGYSGNHTYVLPLSDFNISREIGKGPSVLWVRLYYRDYLISEDREEVLA